MVDKQTIDLGTVLRHIPEFEFSMNEFNDRLRLQKIIYLLQAFDVFLGYHYSWYIHGPYCSTLATCGFALEGIYDKIPIDAKAVFTDPNVKARFERFKKFISKREMDADFLEIAASIHLSSKLVPGAREDVIERVSNKKKKFTKEQVERIWEELQKWELVKT